MNKEKLKKLEKNNKQLYNSHYNTETRKKVLIYNTIRFVTFNKTGKIEETIKLIASMSVSMTDRFNLMTAKMVWK